MAAASMSLLAVTLGQQCSLMLSSGIVVGVCCVCSTITSVLRLAIFRFVYLLRNLLWSAVRRVQWYLGAWKQPDWSCRIKGLVESWLYYVYLTLPPNWSLLLHFVVILWPIRRKSNLTCHECDVINRFHVIARILTLCCICQAKQLGVSSSPPLG